VNALPRASATLPDPSATRGEELRLLTAAQDALAHDPARALALAEEHARRHPAGALAQEREVLAIDALARAGRRDEAEARAARFRARYPGSASAPRIETILGR
jgi:outer membrane protein assembly factor BamD (BamD/ComL family)